MINVYSVQVRFPKLPVRWQMKISARRKLLAVGLLAIVAIATFIVVRSLGDPNSPQWWLKKANAAAMEDTREFTILTTQKDILDAYVALGDAEGACRVASEITRPRGDSQIKVFLQDAKLRLINLFSKRKRFIVRNQSDGARGRGSVWLEVARMQIAAGDLTKARASAAAADESRALAWCEVAESYAKAGNKAAFRECITYAKDAMAATTDSWGKIGLAVPAIVIALIRAGKDAEATAVLESLTDPNDRGMACERVAAEFASAKDPVRRRMMLRLAEAAYLGKPADPEDEQSPLISVAEGYVSLGDYDEAKRLALLVNKDGGYASIAGKFAEAGRMNYALDLVERITDPAERPSAWLSIAVSQANTGAAAAAAEVAQHHLQSDERRYVYLVIGRKAGEDGNPSAQRKWLSAAEEYMPASTDPQKNAYAALQLANAWANSGNAAKTIELAEKAIAAGEQIVDDRKRTNMGANVEERHTIACSAAEVLAEVGQFEKALAIVRARQIRAYYRWEACEAIARNQADRGDFQAALATAGMITDEGDTWRNDSFESIAMAQAKAGKQGSIMSWAKGLKDPFDRAYAYLGAARGLIEKAQDTRNSGRASLNTPPASSSVGPR